LPGAATPEALPEASEMYASSPPYQQAEGSGQKAGSNLTISTR
jgi:hypothetical protein